MGGREVLGADEVGGGVVGFVVVGGGVVVVVVVGGVVVGVPDVGGVVVVVVGGSVVEPPTRAPFPAGAIRSSEHGVVVVGVVVPGDVVVGVDEVTVVVELGTNHCQLRLGSGEISAT